MGNRLEDDIFKPGKPLHVRGTAVLLQCSSSYWAAARHIRIGAL